MIKKKVLVLSVPEDTREWIVKQAGERRMTISDYTLSLIQLGIQANSIDDGVAKITAAVEAGGVSRMMLREILITRYMVEQQVKGTIRNVVTLPTDAATYADQQLKKTWPIQE
jgi:hypothetical protein